MTNPRTFYRTIFNEQPSPKQYQEILDIRRSAGIPVTIYGPDDSGMSHPSGYLYVSEEDIEKVRDKLTELVGAFTVQKEQH